jgi:hypothetical protein
MEDNQKVEMGENRGVAATIHTAVTAPAAAFPLPAAAAAMPPPAPATLF